MCTQTDQRTQTTRVGDLPAVATTKCVFKGIWKVRQGWKGQKTVNAGRNKEKEEEEARTDYHYSLRTIHELLKSVKNLKKLKNN